MTQWRSHRKQGVPEIREVRVCYGELWNNGQVIMESGSGVQANYATAILGWFWTTLIVHTQKRPDFYFR